MMRGPGLVTLPGEEVRVTVIDHIVVAAKISQAVFFSNSVFLPISLVPAFSPEGAMTVTRLARARRSRGAQGNAIAVTAHRPI